MLASLMIRPPYICLSAICCAGLSLYVCPCAPDMRHAEDWQEGAHIRPQDQWGAAPVGCRTVRAVQRAWHQQVSAAAAAATGRTSAAAAAAGLSSESCSSRVPAGCGQYAGSHNHCACAARDRLDAVGWLVCATALPAQLQHHESCDGRHGNPACWTGIQQQLGQQ